MSTDIKKEPENDYHGQDNGAEIEEVDIKVEKNTDLPTKSSMEILSELFSTFHAEPPLLIKKEKSEESNGKKHKKKKKHKHKEKKHKKKSKKRHRTSSSSSEQCTKVDLAELLIKQEKDVSTKRIMIEGTDLSFAVNECKIENEEIANESDSKTPIGSPSIKRSKIVIQDLKSNSVFETILKASKHDETSTTIKDKKHKKKHKHKSKKRSRSKSKEKHEKRLKLDDLRDILKDKESKYRKHKYSDKSSTDDYEIKTDHKNKERDRSKDKSYDRHLSNKHDDYYRLFDDCRKSRKDNPFYKNYKDEMSYRSRDRERDTKWNSRER